MRVSMNLTAKGCSVSDRDKVSKTVSEEMREHYGPFIDRASLGPCHYEGCWKDHWVCAVARLLDACDRLQSVHETPAEHPGPVVAAEALTDLWEVMDRSEEGRNGEVKFDADAWREILTTFWKLGGRYREELFDLGWSPPKTSGKPECPTCRTELAFEGDVCGLCNPEVQP